MELNVVLHNTALAAPAPVLNTMADNWDVMRSMYNALYLLSYNVKNCIFLKLLSTKCNLSLERLEYMSCAFFSQSENKSTHYQLKTLRPD